MKVKDICLAVSFNGTGIAQQEYTLELLEGHIPGPAEER